MKHSLKFGLSFALGTALYELLTLSFSGIDWWKVIFMGAFMTIFSLLFPKLFIQKK